MSSVSYSNWQTTPLDPYQQQQQPQQQQQQQPHQQQPHQQQQQQQHQYSNPDNTGPRAKCDQVIFEAIAKAAEIIVNGRCASSKNGSGGNNYQHQQQQQQYNIYGGGNHTNAISSSSSRFNLMVPEIAAVRQILQRWRRALHVPLRLDLYYHNPSAQGQDKRELLERWCLEYTPSSQDPFFERECRSSDPIVQLRHVCKKIVIWLRNLYCSSRLLPAQAFQHPTCANITQIGFSIYVLAQGSDDWTDLVQNQGFQCHKQPSTVLTPYGELTWQVFHSSKKHIERYLPPHHPFKAPLWMPREPSGSRPIQSTPMAIPRNTSTSAMDQIQLSTTPNNNNNNNTQPIRVPQSAPAGANYFPQALYHNNNNNNSSNNNNNNNPTGPNENQHAHHPPNTYHNQRHMMHHRASSEAMKFVQHQHEDVNNNHNNHNNPHFLQRRNTSIGIQENNHRNGFEEDMEHPERLLSGLSLALANEDAKDATNDTTSTTDATQVEKRRAALHHAPPHLMESKQQQQQQQQHYHHHHQYNNNGNDRKQQQPTNAGEYGYAYNNHIAWNQIRPSSTVPIALPGQSYDSRNQGQNEGRLADQSYSPSRQSYSPSRGRLGSSPSPLAGTPPSGAFLRVTVGGGNTPISSPSLIPPRNTAAPPFPTRPMGFASDAPAQAPLATDPHLHAQNQHHSNETAEEEMAAPMTTLDLLHSSPFQNPFQQGAFSSMSGGAGGMGSQLNSQASLLRPPALGSALASSSAIPPPISREEEENLECDMPFAVDLDSMSTTQLDSGKGGSEGAPFATDSSLTLGSSSAVASFAQKCAPTQHRLKLFESLHGSRRGDAGMQMPDCFGAGSTSEELSNQLSDFRNFAASLSVPASNHRASGSGSDESGSMTTPIPMRTS